VLVIEKFAFRARKASILLDVGDINAFWLALHSMFYKRFLNVRDLKIVPGGEKSYRGKLQ